MMKKRNMAVAMAAVSVASAVAPVFAAVDNARVDEATLIAKVEEMLNTKYSNAKETGGEGSIVKGQEYKNSVYMITNNAGNVRITSIQDLKDLIEKSKVSNTPLQLNVKDKGHKEVNGEIVGTEENDYLVYDGTTVALPSDGTIGTLAGAVGVGTVVTSSGVATITLKNGDEIEVTTGDYALDLNKPVDINGNLVDVNTTDLATAKRVVGFKHQIDTVNGVTEKDIPSKNVDGFVYGADIATLEMNYSDIKTTNGYTAEGAKLVNTLIAANKNGSNTTTVVKDGKLYTIVFDALEVDGITAKDLSAVTALKDGGYKFDITFKACSGNVTPTHNNVKLTIKGDTHANLTALRNYIANTSSTSVMEGNTSLLAGNTRFQTAIEVSKATYASLNEDTTITSRDEAKAVVLVGRDAVVDGLAAAPLAAVKDAPILLTDKNEINADTMKEIKRILPKGSEIILVGGETNISKEVEKQLINEMNAKITRLAGNTRYETSVEIAEELTTMGAIDINSNAFVIGGYGLADAMSIASVAAMDTNSGDGIKYTVSPILVTPAEGLHRDVKDFLKDGANNITTVDVIGGETKVSTQVMKDIAEIKTAANVERVAGTRRSETNAKVVKQYFTAGSLSNVYVAKDGDAQLVDALAVAPLAGKNNGAIVLATNDLSETQIAEVKTAATTGTNTLTQVGEGVASTIISKLIKTLGL